MYPLRSDVEVCMWSGIWELGSLLQPSTGMAKLNCEVWRRCGFKFEIRQQDDVELHSAHQIRHVSMSTSIAHDPVLSQLLESAGGERTVKPKRGSFRSSHEVLTLGNCGPPSQATIPPLQSKVENKRTCRPSLRLRQEGSATMLLLDGYLDSTA